jgi:hypothetical protein
MQAEKQANVQYPRTETAAGALIPKTRSYLPDRARYEPPPTVTNRRARKRAASFKRDALLFLNNPMFHTPETAALRAEIAATDPLTLCSLNQRLELAARIDQLSEYVKAREKEAVEQERQAAEHERRAEEKIAKDQREAIARQAAEAEAEARREAARHAAVAEREREESARVAREAADKEARRRKAERRAAERAEKETERLRQFRERHLKPRETYLTGAPA